MKGHVPTPPAVVDTMVSRLFAERSPKETDLVLDPGCGDGPYIEGLLRYCETHRTPVPQILGVELNPALVKEAREKFRGNPHVTIMEADYLTARPPKADFIVGNPPYVSIIGLDEREKRTYRALFDTARERFDLYMLFFEKSISQLREGASLCFITPEKFEYVRSATALRRLLGRVDVKEIAHAHEETFEGLVTYPAITLLTNRPALPYSKTKVVNRDGREMLVTLPRDGSPWSTTIAGVAETEGDWVLEDACIRISCGVATGSDEVFVHRENQLPDSLRGFAHPTIAGRQLGPTTRDPIETRDVMVIPYDKKGNILPEHALGDLGTFLARPDIQRKLKNRTCVTMGGRVWYRFHDNVPFADMLRPKILCKDITEEPHFWADRSGRIVPRHSVYYIVPRDARNLDAMLQYLNSTPAKAWLRANCQRAANGFFRLQSAVLRRLPFNANDGNSVPKRAERSKKNLSPKPRQLVLEA